MKLVVFGPERRLGALRGDGFVDLHETDPAIPASLESFIETGESGIVAAKAAVAAGSVIPLHGTKLHAPHVRGARICCAGGNFADHTAAMAAKRTDMKQFPTDLAEIAREMRKRGIWGFWKLGRDAAGPDENIPYPSHAARLDYEGELGIILGKTLKDAKPADLRDAVWGVTLFDDVSIRDVPEPAAGPLNFALQKNFDGSFAIGPCIVVGEDLDWENTAVETLVNGEVRQSFNTRDMVVKFGEYLEFVTRDFTLHPGDMITSGTAAGTAADSSAFVDGKFAPERFLKVGDVVEVRSPAVGSLRNTVVSK